MIQQTELTPEALKHKLEDWCQTALLNIRNPTNTQATEKIVALLLTFMKPDIF